MTEQVIAPKMAVVENKPEMMFAKWLTYALGAVSAVVLNALSGAADQPHMSAMLIRWFAAIPFLGFGIYYAALVYLQHYKLPDTHENDPRPSWMIAMTNWISDKTPARVKTVLKMSVETNLLLVMLGVSAVCLSLAAMLFWDGFELFNQVNALQYQQQVQALMVK
ncbi:hypothetical protein BZA02_11461 [Ruegeria sp. P4]|nr:hypothetical protein BZA02_11461 [Ruegeria sp. P4]